MLFGRSGSLTGNGLMPMRRSGRTSRGAMSSGVISRSSSVCVNRMSGIWLAEFFCSDAS